DLHIVRILSEVPSRMCRSDFPAAARSVHPMRYSGAGLGLPHMRSPCLNPNLSAPPVSPVRGRQIAEDAVVLPSGRFVSIPGQIHVFASGNAACADVTCKWWKLPGATMCATGPSAE